MEQPPVILLTAAEASGDQHAAHLARAIRQRRPDARLVGMGGQRMADAGVELLADLSRKSAMGLGAITRLPQMLSHYAGFGRFLARNRVSLHVPVDSPAFNLPLAGRSKRRGVPVLYYVAPQLWAWGAWRMDKLRRRVDRVACLLPFEPDYFAPHGVQATFVGHPLFEPLIDWRPDAEFISTLPRGEPKVALLPGSRGHEIADHLPAQLRVAAELQRRYPSASFVVAGSPKHHGHSLSLARMVAGSPAKVTLTHGRVHDVLNWADVALTVSGSVTLEVAWFGVPMVVIYRVGRWRWNLLGRRLIKTPFMSLPNIVAGEPAVAELMPWFGQDGPVIDAMDALLADPAGRAAQGARLRSLVAPLAEQPASQRTAELAVELMR